MNILKKYNFKLENLDCANCASKIEEALKKENELKNVNVNFSKLKLSFETNNLDLDKIKNIITSLEPEVVVKDYEEKHNHHHEHHHNHEYHGCDCHNHHHHNHDEKKHNSKIKENDKKIKLHTVRLVLGILLMVISFMNIIPNEMINNIVLILAYVVLLLRTFINSVKLLFKSKTINENLLITISCIGAYLVGERFEGLMVIILYEIGKILEEKAVNKSRKSISKLMDIKPEYANKKDGENIEKVDPKQVKIDDIIVVKKGEKIPLDGIVIKGESKLNTASLTGESKLFDVKENMEVLSGSINEGDILEIKVIREYDSSAVYKILELVENATDKKAKTETFVNKAAKIYTPIVIILAIMVGLFLPIINGNITYSESIYRALIFLVISCPCAIAISVPLSYFSGIGKASKVGILIKGSDYLDILKDTKVICFDKTGTLTKGKFEVEKIVRFNENISDDYVLEHIAIGESFTNHPIAKSLLDYVDLNKDNIDYKSKIDDVVDFKEISGKGIGYTLNGKNILIGNAELVEFKDEIKEIGTVIFLKENENILGYIVLSDIVKENAKELISNLNKKGIVSKMFTGDNLEIAKDIAGKIGIKEIKAEMLPNEKYEEIEKILASNIKGKVAFAGDGLNDSPVLARADIGISMGGVGQEAAIEASDVVIMTDDVSKIYEVINISKKTCMIIKQNLLFAILTKIVVLVLSTFGFAGMWQAIFADVGVTLITVLNTLRILK